MLYYDSYVWVCVSSVFFFFQDHHAVCLWAFGEDVQHDESNPTSKYPEWKEASSSLIYALED